MTQAKARKLHVVRGAGPGKRIPPNTPTATGWDQEKRRQALELVRKISAIVEELAKECARCKPAPAAKAAPAPLCRPCRPCRPRTPAVPA